MHSGGAELQHARLHPSCLAQLPPTCAQPPCKSAQLAALPSNPCKGPPLTAALLQLHNDVEQAELAARALHEQEGGAREKVGTAWAADGA